MARKKCIPQKVIDSDSLSDLLRDVYDKTYQGYSQENIVTLRIKAKNLGVESPTTLNKEQLVKRITDWVISGYLPPEPEKVKEYNPFGTVNYYDKSAQKIEGIFEEYNGEYRIGRILVPVQVAKDTKLRSGDLVEGVVADEGGIKTLAVVNNVEGENKPSARKWFEDIPPAPRRDFGSDLKGEFARQFLPQLKRGERVIADMSLEQAKQIEQSLPCCIGLYMGVEPENESSLSKGSFVVPFDLALRERVRLARLALNRAKRLSERGKDVTLVIYGFDNLGDSDTERALFGAGRCFAQGSLTVIADVNKQKEYGAFAKIATRII